MKCLAWGRRIRSDPCLLPHARHYWLLITAHCSLLTAHCSLLTSSRHTLLPGVNKIFQVNCQSIGDAVDVVEVADDLGGIVDGAVREAVLAQLGNIGVIYLGRGEGEFGGVGTEGTIGGCECGRVPILRNVMYQ